MDYQEQLEEIVSTAQFGDLIQFSYPIGYSHWGVYDGDGHVIHFAVADESKLMNNVRTTMQKVAPVCGDLLLGVTKIRRMPLTEVAVPEGSHVLICNNGHACRPSSEGAMKERRDALLNNTFAYHIFTFNCEHFATFVRYGKALCNQIPGKSKNEECEIATDKFEEAVYNKTMRSALFS